MRNFSRRDFIRQSSVLTTGLLVSGSGMAVTGHPAVRKKVAGELTVHIPMPVQVVIDDVGWWSGEDGSTKQEPYRTGINRGHVPADYQAIVDLGKGLGIRPQAATILCEWDRKNILRELPRSTWMGSGWNNSKWVGPWLEQAADIIRKNQKYLELTLHGIGHEYWEGGKFSRAEWTSTEGIMRPADEVEKHLDYYHKLIDQNNLGDFPGSFVPTAFLHSFGPSKGNKISLASLLHKRGINYINTPFESIFNKERIQHELFGFDDGVMTVDRGQDEFSWQKFPGDPARDLTGPTCGMHWPNMLHPNPERNTEVVEKWISYLGSYNAKPEWMLAPDSVYFQHQLAHHKLTKVKFAGNFLEIDFTEIDKLPVDIGKAELTLKVVTPKPFALKASNIKIVSQTFRNYNEPQLILQLMRESGTAKARIAFS